MKKYLFIFGLVVISFIFFNPIANAAPACGAGPDDWTPPRPVDWLKAPITRIFSMSQGYSIGQPPSGGQEWPYTISDSCTAAAVNGARCNVQCVTQTEYQDYAHCPELQSRLTYCQSPANRIDTVAPTCGSWSGTGPNFTLSGSSDVGNPGGDSGIQIGSGTCTVSGSGTCTVDIYDVAGNKKTCTSPTYNPPVNGACAATHNNCTAGNSVDVTDTSTEYLWACNGTNGGTNAACSETKAATPPSLSCSPRSSSIVAGAGARYSASGGDGTYRWSISGSSCFGEVEPGNPAVFWPGCNTAGSYWVNVSDNSGHSDSCALTVTPAGPLTCSPASQTVAELERASFSATGGVGTLRWEAGGTPMGSPFSGTGTTFSTSYGKCGEKVITVRDDAGSTASCGLTVTGATCGGPPVCNNNGVQDNGETGIDCGGGGCSACSQPPVGCGGAYWNTNPHYVCQNNTCTQVDACGTDSGGCTPSNVGSDCGQPQVGTVTVRADSASASWLLDGPQSAYQGRGTFKQYTVPAPGLYTVIPASGYTVDVPSRALRVGASITFNITRATQPTCFVSAVPSSQTANVGSNASFTATTTCSDGSTPPDNINSTNWTVDKSASFVSGENNSKTTTLKCDSSTGGVPASVTPKLGTLTSVASSLTCNPTLTCSPVNQTGDINQNVSFSAAGGTSYSWSAAGGTPASGSGSSFTTKYGSLGNKTVTVASGTNNATCSVSVIQPTHSECTMVDGAPACVIVDGRAPDRCTNKCDCGSSAPECGGTTPPGGGNPLKYSCKSGSCSVDSTGPYTDSTCGGTCSPTYYSCSGGACMPDANGQFTSADCNNMCVMPIHAVCDPVAKACVNTVGAGENKCNADAGPMGCAGTTQTHLGCVGNACVIMNGPGSDECGAVGEACAAGGGKCSLKTAPPLISGGQSVKLSWQCTGAPTCSLTRKYNNSNTTITVQDPARRTTGSYSDKPTSSATYTLKCDVPAADATASVKVSTLIECAPTDPTCKP